MAEVRNFIHILNKPALELGEENRWALLCGFDYPVMVVQEGDTAALVVVDRPDHDVEKADDLIESLGLMPEDANLFELTDEEYEAHIMKDVDDGS